MIAGLLTPRVAVTAWAITCPTEYASATSALTSAGVPPYLAVYSLTICSLSVLLNKPNQPLGTMIPVALFTPPIAAVNWEPWSGPDAATKIFGLYLSFLNTWTKAATIG